MHTPPPPPPLADLPVDADSTWTLQQWTQLLDPLFSNASHAAKAAKWGKRAGRS
jgi:hypothetical protein